MSKPLPTIIRLWFVADALLALLPPIHWAAGCAGPILGMPPVPLYLFAASTFISASVVAAYLCEGSR